MVKTFWDKGSSIGLVSKKFAQKSCLIGVPITYELTTVGNVTETQDTNLYEVILVDRNKVEHSILAFEIESICGKIGGEKVDQLVNLFPELKLEDVKRFEGEI